MYSNVQFEVKFFIIIMTDGMLISLIHVHTYIHVHVYIVAVVNLRTIYIHSLTEEYNILHR